MNAKPSRAIVPQFDMSEAAGVAGGRGRRSFATRSAPTAKPATGSTITNATSPRSSQIASNTPPTTAERAAPTIRTNARSAVRLKPFNSARCPPPATTKSTAIASHPTSFARFGAWSIQRAAGERIAQVVSAPANASMSVPQKRVRRAVPSPSTRPMEAASATCLVPVAAMPSPATEESVPARFAYSPTSPSPVGPTRSAANFVRAIPISTAMIDAPATMDDDWRIWR